MGELGSIYENQENLRGPDLEHEVTVPRRALDKTDGVFVKVPSRFEVDGQTVHRHESPHDPKGRVKVHLPQNLPDGARLRLRGQGGKAPNHPPGDLYLKISVQTGLPWLTITKVAITFAGLVTVAWLILRP